MPTPGRPSYREKRLSAEMTCDAKQDATFEPRAKRKTKSSTITENKVEYVLRRGRSSSSKLKSPSKEMISDAKYEFESADNRRSSSNERFESEIQEKSNPTETEVGQKSVRRRGRLPSLLPSPNQRAELARENRKKKKEYIHKMENKLELIEKENKIFSDLIEKQKVEIKHLEAEVVYLRSVLYDKKKINRLLMSMNANLQKMRAAEEEEESLKAIQELSIYVHDSSEKEDNSLDENTHIFENLTPLEDTEIVDFSSLGSLFPNEDDFLPNLENCEGFCLDMNPL